MNTQLFHKFSSPGRPAIHPTAIVGTDVCLEEGVTIGPYCVVEGRVKIGPGSVVLPHSVVQGTTFIGAGCRLGPHAVIGTDPQHHRYDGARLFLSLKTMSLFANLRLCTGHPRLAWKMRRALGEGAC
jgi:hypothetical protein